MKKVIIVFVCSLLCILCACSGKENAEKYNICNKKIRIADMYFNNAESLNCSEDNPYREQILSKIEFISQKETREPTEFDFEPEITLIAANGFVFELSDSVTAYSYPDAEGAEAENQDDEAYYIRMIRNDETQTFYFERDDDVIELGRLVNDAVSYEYDNLGTITGVIRHINEEDKCCYIVSSEYGDLYVAANDFDNAIVGDTVEVSLHEKTESADISADCEGTIQNLTNNDITATSGEYLTTLEFSYDILSYEGDFENNMFRTDRFELEYDKEDFDFLMELCEDCLPADVIQHLKEKYDSSFFENNILLYCGLDVPDVEVTAVAQTNWAGGGNMIYVRQNSNQEAPSLQYYILWVEVSKKDWNENDFSLYLFE